MIPKPEGWTIVVVGHWNRAILTPVWIADKVFEQPEIETLVSWMPLAPVVYRKSSVEIQVLNDRLLFHPRQLNDSDLEAAEQACCKVLNKLPHTPVTAIGINYRFVEEDPDKELLELFNLPDVASVLEERWVISQRKLVRQLNKDGTTLNLTLTLQEQKSVVDIECNFHNDTPLNDSVDSAVAACTAIDGQALGLRDTALHLLESVYGLRLAEERIET